MCLAQLNYVNTKDMGFGEFLFLPNTWESGLGSVMQKNLRNKYLRTSKGKALKSHHKVWNKTQGC